MKNLCRNCSILRDRDRFLFKMDDKEANVDKYFCPYSQTSMVYIAVFTNYTSHCTT